MNDTETLAAARAAYVRHYNASQEVARLLGYTHLSRPMKQDLLKHQVARAKADDELRRLLMPSAYTDYPKDVHNGTR